MFLRILEELKKKKKFSTSIILMNDPDNYIAFIFFLRMDKNKIAESINILGKFLGRRDIDDLTKEELKKKFNIEQVDVVILYGGSIIYGGDLLAMAIKNGIGKKYMVSGGAGHTTQTLRDTIHSLYPDIDVEGKPEAECFTEYMRAKYNVVPDLLETESTNCGNNVTFSLELLKKNGINPKSMIVMQDSTMQLRMDAGLRKYCSSDVTIINYGVFQVDVISENNELKYKENILGMWKIERYISLLMGEIPRLTDDENGYGPKGKNFIAHVDIPESVSSAFAYLKQDYNELIRIANPAYATK